jgi:hypothetical protein
MDIQDFVEQHASVKPGADIVERWNGRIVKAGWHRQGAAGAEKYIEKYGRGLKAPKVIALARIAEMNGCTLIAARFWETAHLLSAGEGKDAAARYPLSQASVRGRDRRQSRESGQGSLVLSGASVPLLLHRLQ